MFQQRRQHTIFFAKIYKKQKKSYKVSLFPKQVLSYQRGGKKVKASDKNMKKYKDLYEVEKQRFEETLQRYQENHIDEVEIISLHKRCNKTRTKAKPVVKQSLELIETDPGHSYLEINLRHIVFDSIEASVGLEGTYRGKKNHMLEHVIMATALK